MKINKNICREYKKFNITVADFSEIFKQLQQHILNIYNIYNIERFNQDAKKYLLHFLIQDICNSYIELKRYHDNVIILIQPNFLDEDLEFFKYYDKHEVCKYILNTFKKIQNKLPVPVYVSKVVIDLKEESKGELIEILNLLKNNKDLYDLKSPNLNKIKKFAINNGLTNIAEKYMCSDKTMRIFQGI